jgi:Tol biopolymer transport system component
MPERKPFLIVGGAIGCLALLFCLGIAALAGIEIYGNNALNLQKVNRIAYMDDELNIQVIDSNGENRVVLTSDAKPDNDLAYIFPTWSPDSKHLAFVRIGGTSASPDGTLLISNVSGGEPYTIFKSSSLIPFYLYWSPDSQRIGFLTQSSNEMSLMLGNADGKGDPRKLESGSPFYWAWSPDSRTLLAHIGGSKRDSHSARLALLKWQTNDSPQMLAQGPATFQAPQYSPDGSMILYAGTGDSDQDALYAADADGGHLQTITNYDGRIAFAWSPDGKRIAWMTTPVDSELPYLGPLFVGDKDGKNAKQIGNEDILAFSWSPDGKRIAYLTLLLPGSQGCSDCSRGPGLSAPLDQGHPIQFRWRVAEIDQGRVWTLATFAPTANFISVLPYFDQYARSVTFWSPDGKNFVYTQREEQGSGGVWVTDVVENTTPRRIADGTLAVWSWK